MDKVHEACHGLGWLWGKIDEYVKDKKSINAFNEATTELFAKKITKQENLNCLYNDISKALKAIADIIEENDGGSLGKLFYTNNPEGKNFLKTINDKLGPDAVNDLANCMRDAINTDLPLNVRNCALDDMWVLYGILWDKLKNNSKLKIFTKS